ncbi:hypothetical protein JXQ70_14120 [bacterium]|nr:hypothetical protein [bacterium]
MRRLKMLIWKEFRESNGLIVGMLILMLLSLAPGLLYPAYFIDKADQRVQLFIMACFGFVFGAFAWGHDFESKTASFLETLPIKIVGITRAKFVYYGSLVALTVLTSYGLNRDLTSLVIHYHEYNPAIFTIELVTRIFRYLIVYAYSFILAWCLRRVLVSVGVSLLTFVPYFLLMYFCLVLSACLFWPLWPTDMFSALYILWDYVNIILYTIALSITIFFLPKRRSLVFLMLLVLVPAILLPYNIVFRHWSGTSWLRDYDGMPFWSDNLIDLHYKSSNFGECRHYFRFDFVKNSVIDAKGILLKRVNAGIVEIDPRQRTATLKSLPSPFFSFDLVNMNTVFSADGQWAVFPGWLPNKDLISSWLASNQARPSNSENVSPLSQNWRIWLWERRTNRLSTLDFGNWQSLTERRRLLAEGQDQADYVGDDTHTSLLDRLPLARNIKIIGHIQRLNLLILQELTFQWKYGSKSLLRGRWGKVYAYNLTTKKIDTLLFPDQYYSPEEVFHHFILEQQDYCISPVTKKVYQTDGLKIPLPDTETIDTILRVPANAGGNTDRILIVKSRRTDHSFVMRLFSSDFKSILYEWFSRSDFEVVPSPNHEHILIMSRQTGPKPTSSTKPASECVSFTLSLFSLDEFDSTEIVTFTMASNHYPVLKWSPDGGQCLIYSHESQSARKLRLYTLNTHQLSELDLVDNDFASIDWCSSDTLALLTFSQKVMLYDVHSRRQENIPLTIVPLFQERGGEES